MKLDKKNILVVPDLHEPFALKGFRKHCKKIQIKYRCGTVVFLGDIVDNHSISYHEHDPDLWSPVTEMKKADGKLKLWFKDFPNAYIVWGNHDCENSETDILTDSGWKKGINLNEFDLVATYNINTKEIEFQKPLRTIKKQYAGSMVEYNSSRVKFSTTPNHRFYTKNYEHQNLPVKCVKAEDLPYLRNVMIPVSGVNAKQDYSNVSDGMLSLIGWLLTDGYISNNKWFISQSKEANIDSIKQILKDNHIEYKLRIRHRNITHICGKKLKNKPLPEHVFSLKSKSILKFLGTKDIPDWFDLLSKRQFDIVLNAMVLGNGSKYVRRGVNHTSFVLYGKKKVLDRIQGLCVRNNFSCGMSYFNNNGFDDFRLNITPQKEYILIDHRKIKLTPYRGLVWCVTVPNSTIVVRHRGVVSIHGNCLPDRKGKTVGLPKRCFRSFREMWNLPKGWIDGPEFIIHDVLFKHSGSGTCLNTAIAARQSVVIGHTHSHGMIAWNVSAKDRIFGMNPGCGVDRHSLAFAYGKNFKNKPFISCGVILNSGTLPMLIPMELTKKAKKKRR